MSTYNSFLFCGHGRNKAGAYDSGALSVTKEHETVIAQQIINSAVKYLEPTKLVMHLGSNNYSDNLTKGNYYYALSGATVHLNSGGGTGVEVFVPCKEKDLGAEVEFCKDVATLLNTKNRGVKSRDYNSEKTFNRVNGSSLNYTDWYREIREAWNNGFSLAIIEVGFIDNSIEFDKIKKNIDEIGFLVAKYIAKINGKTLTKPTPAQTPAQTTYYRVVCGSYGKRENAEKMVAELKSKGYSPFIDIYKK